MMTSSHSTKNSVPVLHAQLATNQLETNQLEVNQPVASQLEKNHQQEVSRTSPLCSVKTLFSLLIVLLMTVRFNEEALVIQCL